MIIARTLLALSALALAAGCRSTAKAEAPPPRPDWGLHDVETVSRVLVDRLLESPELSYVSGTSADDLRIPAFSAGFSNETNRDIDQHALTDAVERLLLASGRFRLVSEGDGEPPQGGPRHSTGMSVDQARERAAELGAEVAIVGVLRSRRGSQEEGGDRVYELELACLEIAREEILWTSVRRVSPSEGDLFVQN